MSEPRREAEPQENVLDTSIKDVIQHSYVSVRLSNALLKAGHRLPFETVGDYLQAGATAKGKFLSIPNLGWRSVNELDEVLRSFAAELPREAFIGWQDAAEDASHESQKLASLRQTLLQLFSDLRFPGVFLESRLPTRLANVLSAAPHLACPVADFLDDIQGVCEQLQRQKNSGRTSIAQLVALAEQLTTDGLKSSGFSDELIASARAVIFDKSMPSDEAAAQLKAVLETAPKVFTHADASAQPAATIVAQAMNELPDRERDILERRYGFHSGRIETLEEIGVVYNVTRERIRQLESKGIRAIGKSKTAKRLRQSFEAEIGSRLQEATRDLGYIRDGYQSEVLRRLSAADRIVIDVLYESHGKFLRRFARHWHGGWILLPLEKERLDDVRKELKTRVSAVKLPAAFEEIVDGIPPETARIALELGTDLSVAQGYVLAGRVGPRPRRAIGLHRCLVASGGVVEIGDLVARYRQVTPNDKRSSVRDATIVMIMAPHLFLGVFDRHWYGLGQAGTLEHAAVADQDEQSDAEDEELVEPPDAAGIRGVLRQILLDQGPLRFVELRDRAVLRLKGKSLHSIGPVLLTSGEFVRPLPGIYALPEQIPTGESLLSHPPAFLLAEDQVRYLAEARYAEEPFGRFPLWIPEAEYALCRWAQSSCDPLAFQSLLAVASIDHWPVSSEEREHWSALKKKHGRYAMTSAPRYPIEQLWPPLDRVLAACVVACGSGGLSWIAANRVLKRRLDAHVAPGILALMVAIGALDAPPQWQMFHKAGDRLTDIVRTLSSHLHRDGVLDWESPAGTYVLEMLGAARSAPKSGWVDQTVVDQLIATAGHRADIALPSASEADESASSLDELLREVAQTKQAETAHLTLRTVLRGAD